MGVVRNRERQLGSGWEEGWGIDMIDDLKLLKSKIDERILKMERRIAEESE